MILRALGVCTVVGLSLASGARAQGVADDGDSRSASQRAWALYLSLGPGLTRDGSGGGVLALTYQLQHIVMSGRLSWSDEEQPCSECWPDAADLALVVGIGSRPGRRLHASAAAGLSLASYDPGGSASVASGVSLAIEGQLSWRVTRLLGPGLYGWGNSLGPQGGIGIVLQLGRLR